MIPEVFVTAWSVDHPWPQPAQVEQDLLLSQAMCMIANHPYLGGELVLRGGTGLHKLCLDRPWRYSEDLDFVRRSATGIGEATRTLTELGRQLGFRVSTRINVYPKVMWRTEATDGSPLRIKIEMNTQERHPVREPHLVKHQVTSGWWTGSADVAVCDPAELLATKIRALYQRSKGRDLFDLWLGLTELALDPAEIIEIFNAYRPARLTVPVAEQALRTKLDDPGFRHDLDPLVTSPPGGYDVQAAADLVVTQLLRRLG